jgi:HAD superfamily hydrolase (TIGR01548 family)
VNDLGNGIQATDDALRIARDVDTVVFDVDGVLIDVSHSFRSAISKAVQHYLAEHLGWPGDELFLRVSETELFKKAGGFNSDWALADAAVLLYVVKGADASNRSASFLRKVPPRLEEYTAAIHARGGGLDAARETLRERFGPETIERGVALWDSPLVERLCAEHYAGRRLCRDMYGFDAAIVDFDEGEMIHERRLIEPERLPGAWKYGVLTGRNNGEMRAALTTTGLAGAIPPEWIATCDDGVHKPDPNGLLLLTDRMAPAAAAFVGDTIDDLRTVLNYRKVRSGPPWLACAVLSGPAGEKNRDFFAASGADVIAPDVNALIAWLASRALSPNEEAFA